MTEIKTVKPQAFHRPESSFAKRNGSIQAACLLKYFPKYYRKLVINLALEDWPITSKLRQTKVIENLVLDDVKRISRKDEAENFKKLEERIFRNKRKSVKSLPIAQTPGLGTARKIKHQVSNFLPRIKSLDLSLISNLSDETYRRARRIKPVFLSRKQEHETWLSYSYFWNGFRYLKHLKMSSKTKNIWLILKEINLSSRFLSALETLKLCIQFQDHPNEITRIRNFLFDLEKNGHFLNHLTHLNCEEFPMFHSYETLIASILSQCPKLVSLSFPIGKEAIFYDHTLFDIYRECQETRVLSQVETMNSLRTLNISAYGVRTLAKHFSISQSVQTLSLYVGHSFFQSDLLDVFQESEYGFFERWKEFHNLQNLKIKMRIIEEPNDLLTKFAKPLLEATPNLKKFTFELAESPACGSDDCSPLDFSLLLENEALVKKLESFKIVAAEGTQITFDPEKNHLLCNLRKLVIKAGLLVEVDLKDFLQAFLSASCSKIKKTLKIPSLSWELIEAFSEFIKLALRRIRTGDLALDMGIDLTVHSCRELFQNFKIPLMLPEKSGGSVRLNLLLTTSSEDRELSNFFKKEFKRIFGSLNLSVYRCMGYSKTQLI